MMRFQPTWFLRIFLLFNIIMLIIGLLVDYITSANSVVWSSVNFRSDGCIKKEFDDNSKEFKVPNIVHYIWYTEEPKVLKFYHMLSILSCRKFIQPKVIYFHTNLPPVGRYWNHVKNIDILKVIYRQPPTTLFGETIKKPFYYTSHSNVDRVKILMEFGGIYLDLDMLAVQSFDELRRHTCTIGREQQTKACGSVIVCAKDSPFLTLWMNSYFDDYRIEEWAYNSGQVPYNLAQRFPYLINLEETRLNRPNFLELDQIWGPKRFDWTRNYAIHLWYRLWKDTSEFYKGVEPNETNIGEWGGVFGEMARRILFDDVRVTKLKYNL